MFSVTYYLLCCLVFNRFHMPLRASTTWSCQCILVNKNWETKHSLQSDMAVKDLNSREDLHATILSISFMYIYRCILSRCMASSAFLMVSVAVDIFRRVASNTVFKGSKVCSRPSSYSKLEVSISHNNLLTVQRELTNGGTQSRDTRSSIVRSARAKWIASVFSPPPRSIPAIWGGF